MQIEPGSAVGSRRRKARTMVNVDISARQWRGGVRWGKKENGEERMKYDETDDMGDESEKEDGDVEDGSNENCKELDKGGTFLSVMVPKPRYLLEPGGGRRGTELF